MKLVKSPKTGKFSAVFQTDHGQRSITTGTCDRKEAIRMIRAAKVEELEHAARVQRLTGQAIVQIVAGKRVTVADAISEWIAWMENYGQSPRTVDNGAILLASWMREGSLADKLPSYITERMVDQWINAADGTSAATRRVRLATVRSFFKFCCAKAYALGNPSNLVRVKMNLLTHQQKEPRIVAAFTNEELDRLIDATTGFWRTAIIIGRHTGLRLGDICQLEWECLAEPGKITVWTEKRDTRVSLPLEGELATLLASLPHEHNVYLFPEQREIAMDPEKEIVIEREIWEAL